MIVRQSHITFGKKGDKYYEKVLCGQTGDKIYNMLETWTDEIWKHYYRKCIQDATYRVQIDELEKREVVIHVDYSENFENNKMR